MVSSIILVYQKMSLKICSSSQIRFTQDLHRRHLLLLWLTENSTGLWFCRFTNILREREKFLKVLKIYTMKDYLHLAGYEQHMLCSIWSFTALKQKSLFQLSMINPTQLVSSTESALGPAELQLVMFIFSYFLVQWSCLINVYSIVFSLKM